MTINGVQSSAMDRQKMLGLFHSAYAEGKITYFTVWLENLSETIRRFTGKQVISCLTEMLAVVKGRQLASSKDIKDIADLYKKMIESDIHPMFCLEPTNGPKYDLEFDNGVELDEFLVDVAAVG